MKDRQRFVFPLFGGLSAPAASYGKYIGCYTDNRKFLGPISKKKENFLRNERYFFLGDKSSAHGIGIIANTIQTKQANNNQN